MILYLFFSKRKMQENFYIMKVNSTLNCSPLLLTLNILIILPWGNNGGGIFPGVNGSTEESKLIKHLLHDYDKLSRPVKEDRDILIVFFDMNLLQIIDVDEKRQIITVNIWQKVLWNDTKLIWKPQDFDNITEVRIPPNLIWRPDIALYNTATVDVYREKEGVNTYVWSHGQVLYVPPMIVKLTCKMDVTWFPFDEQKCELKFGSWTFSGDHLDLQLVNHTADLTEYMDNGEWELIGAPTRRAVKYYPCCKDEPYIHIYFQLHIRRRSFYYFFNLIVPCALIGFLALLGFTLPPDSGEKLPLGVTVLFSLIVFLNMIAESMPANSDAVPLLGTYFNCVMFMIASSVISTIVINLNQRATEIREIGGRPKEIFLYWLPWILRMTPPPVSQRRISMLKGSSPKNTNGSTLGHYLDYENDNERQKMIRREWRFVAVVVDRMCLIVSVLFTIIAFIALFVSARRN